MKQRIVLAICAVLGVLALAAAGLFVWANNLPREHTASTSIAIAAPPTDVWKTIRDFGRMHQWAPDIVPLQRVDAGGKMAYWMDGDDGKMLFTVAQETPGELLVVELTAEPPVFGGRWIWKLEPSDGGTRVTLTEDGWVDPPLFRLAMTLGGMYDDTVIAHCEALKSHLEG